MASELEASRASEPDSSADFSMAMQTAKAELEQLIEALETRNRGFGPYEDNHILVRAVLQSAKLLVALASSNECQMDVPFAPMQRIRKADGTIVWRCNHPTPHETP
jgi:hypothetical protein